MLVVLATLLAYGLTSEYGASPNGDLAADLLRSVLSLTPLLVFVAALVWFGLSGARTGLSQRARGSGAAGAALVTVVAALAAIALGQQVPVSG